MRSRNPALRPAARPSVVPAAVLLLALALALAPATADAQGTSLPAGGTEAARATLRQAIDLYVVGRYQEAAQKLRPLVETRSLRDPVDQGEALRAYGISMVLIGARAGCASSPALGSTPPSSDPRSWSSSSRSDGNTWRTRTSCFADGAPRDRRR